MSSTERIPGSVEPVADDGVAAVAVGTVLWGVALVIAIVLRDRLADAGHLWVLWTCVAGLVVGGITGAIVWRRHLVYRAHRQALAEATGTVGDPT